jgi:hypothetical protein
MRRYLPTAGQGGNMQGPTMTIRNALKLTAVLSIFVMLSSSLGCAFGEIYWTDPLKREYTLGEVQKRYTNLVRFGAFTQASKFVDPELATQFLDNFPSSETVVFTDSESERILFNEDGDRAEATVRVTYSAYYTSSPVVFEIVETQTWYREGAANNWLVRPEFDGLAKFASN